MTERMRALTIPAERLGSFRAAVSEALAFEAGCVKDEASDDQSAARLLDQDASLLRQLLGAGAEAIEVRADADTLAHALHTMAKTVVMPRLAEALEIGPLDPEEVRPALAELSWAIDRAEAFFEIAEREMKAKREAVAS
jgi:hypothetical protein